MEQASLKARPSLRLERLFPVAPEKAWRAWTDSEALKRWWGPDALDRVSVAELDVRVGGRLRFVLRDPEGEYHDIRGVYLEVAPDRKLVFTWNLHDAAPEAESTVTVLLTSVSGGTELEFTLDPVFDPRAGDGWRGAFKRLGELFQGETTYGLR